MLVCVRIGKYSVVFGKGREGFGGENLKETRFESRYVWWQGNIKINLRKMKSEFVDEINLRMRQVADSWASRRRGIQWLAEELLGSQEWLYPHGISSGFASISAPWPYPVSRRFKLLTWKVAYGDSHDYRISETESVICTSGHVSLLRGNFEKLE